MLVVSQADPRKIQKTSAGVVKQNLYVLSVTSLSASLCKHIFQQSRFPARFVYKNPVYVYSPKARTSFETVISNRIIFKETKQWQIIVCVFCFLLIKDHVPVWENLLLNPQLRTASLSVIFIFAMADFLLLGISDNFDGGAANAIISSSSIDREKCTVTTALSTPASILKFIG